MNGITAMAVSIDDDNSSISDLVLVGDELPNTNDLLDMLTMSSPPVQLEILDSTPDFMHYGPPNRTTFEGDFKFIVEVNSKDTHKKKFLYSNLLNRIYVNMMDNFPIQFNWDGNICGPPMYVRATVVFSDEAEAEKRVERCVQHLHERPGDTDDRQSIVRHVLQSSREMNTPGVLYYGDPNVPNSWYSIMVEFNKQSNDPCTHAYKFVCKTSCSSGINRRATSIIFTLENGLGKVYGRQMVGVRVCACPRRDMVRDEQSVDKSKPGKRRASPPSASVDHALKRLKTEAPAADDQLLMLPQLPVIDMRTIATGLEVMQRMMEQGIEQTTDPQQSANYLRCIDAFKQYLNSIRNN